MPAPFPVTIGVDTFPAVYVTQLAGFILIVFFVVVDGKRTYNTQMADRSTFYLVGG